MAIELPTDLDVIDERLRSLEDRILAERLFQENPELFSEGPPQTERQVLAWATRRFGPAVIAVTAAVSIAAGYLLGPLVIKHDRPSPAAAVTAGALVATPKRPAAQHRAKPVHVTRAAPVHAAHAAPVHVAPAVVRRAPVYAHRAAVVYPTVHHRSVVVAPIPNQAFSAENERAVQAEYARRRRAAAAHDAAAQQAQANATAQRTAARTAPAPRTQPRTETATGVATGTATTTAAGPVEVPVSTQQPVDVPAPSGNPKSPVTNPSGVWNEHPPLPVGPYGNPAGPVMADPCTPRRGRLGAVLDTLQRANVSAGHFHL